MANNELAYSIYKITNEDDRHRAAMIFYVAWKIDVILSLWSVLSFFVGLFLWSTSVTTFGLWDYLFSFENDYLMFVFLFSFIVIPVIFWKLVKALLKMFKIKYLVHNLKESFVSDKRYYEVLEMFKILELPWDRVHYRNMRWALR